MVTRVKVLPDVLLLESAPAEIIIDPPAPLPVLPVLAEPEPAQPGNEVLMSYGLWLAQQLGRKPWCARVLDMRDQDDMAELAELKAQGWRASPAPHCPGLLIAEKDLEGQLIAAHGCGLAEAAYRAKDWYPVSAFNHRFEVHAAALMAVTYDDFPRRHEFIFWRAAPGTPALWDLMADAEARGQRVPLLMPVGPRHAPVCFTGAPSQRIAPGQPQHMPGDFKEAAPAAAFAGMPDPFKLLTTTPAAALEVADLAALDADIAALEDDDE